MNIIYPEELIKKKVMINAYGQKTWGDVCYHQKISGSSFKVLGNIEFIRGYRQAIKDIKRLNRKSHLHEKE